MDKATHCIIKAAQLRARALRLEKVAELTENNRRNNAATLLNFGLGAGALGGGAYGVHRLLQNIRAKEQMSALNSGRDLLGKGALGKGALGNAALGSEVLSAELLKASDGGAPKTVGKGIKTLYNSLAAKRKLAKLALILGIGAGSVGAGLYGVNKLLGGLNNNLETLRNNLSIRGLLGGMRGGVSNKSSRSENIVDSVTNLGKSSTVSRGADKASSAARRAATSPRTPGPAAVKLLRKMQGLFKR